MSITQVIGVEFKQKQSRVEQLYGEDSERACESMKYQLQSWTKYVKAKEHGYQWIDEHSDMSAPDVVPQYFMLLREDEARNSSSYRMERHDFMLKDERPYFQDPVPLGFDPLEACARDNGRGEEGVPLAKVWVDPLARTLWMALKARHLTNQYFREACMAQARWLRQKPPRTADDMSLSLDLSFSIVAYYCRVQIYPYIVRILIDEGRWPWFRPPGIPQEPLRWIVSQGKS